MMNNHKRTRNITFRLSEIDHKRALERARRSGAKNLTVYIRAAILTGDEFQMPAHETLRDLRNAVINANHAHDLPALIGALDRISQL